MGAKPHFLSKLQETTPLTLLRSSPLVHNRDFYLVPRSVSI